MNGALHFRAPDPSGFTGPPAPCPCRIPVTALRLEFPPTSLVLRFRIRPVAMPLLVAAVLTASFGLGAGAGILWPARGLVSTGVAGALPSTSPVDDGNARQRPEGHPGTGQAAGAAPDSARPEPRGTFDPTRLVFPIEEPRDLEPTAGAAPVDAARPGAAELGLDPATVGDTRLPVRPPSRIELYAGAASIEPGERLELHVSTPAAGYQLAVRRVDATRSEGFETVAWVGSRPGRDYRDLATFDQVTRTARANWPVTDRFQTGSWRPGVYLVEAADSSGTQGRAIFVVRTPVLRAGATAFVFTALTYQAYNLWGGANLYAYAAPQASRVSFERPYDQAGGRGFWTRYDDRILAWLQRQGLDLQYTTDYDLAVQPPERAPGLLVLPQHAEYVPRSLRDWVNRHLNEIGDLNVLSFGANGFYWQVRLAAPRTVGAPLEIVCYKDAQADPAAAVAPDLVTTRWRDAPLSQPEGRMLGAQYVGILGGAPRFDLRVTDAMPGSLLSGTGWSDGTVIRGLLAGEGDATEAGAGGLAVMAGDARDGDGRPLRPTVTIRTSPAGGRSFMAGTFAWADGLPPARINLGVPAWSFEQFNLNVLAWLGAR